MLYILLTLALFASFGLIMLYLSTAPSFERDGIPLQAVGRAATVLDSMSAVAPASEEGTMRDIRSAVALSSSIVSGVKSDEIACVAPTGGGQEPVRARMILSGQAAYADTQPGEMFGDAVVTPPTSTLYVDNPLLNTLKANEVKYDALSSRMLLAMDAADVKFRARMQRRAEETRELLLSLRTELITACSEQRTRLRRTHPQLSHYHFKHESVHDRSRMPTYTFGAASSPLAKRSRPVSSPDALVAEHYAYD